MLQELVGYLASREGIKLNKPELLRIERTEDGKYRLGQQIVGNIVEVKGAVKAVKRSVPITALQIDRPFEVMTSEGIMQGKRGDWLIQGVVGEVYICPDFVFKRSYDYPT